MLTCYFIIVAIYLARNSFGKKKPVNKDWYRKVQEILDLDNRSRLDFVVFKKNASKIYHKFSKQHFKPGERQRFVDEYSPQKWTALEKDGRTKHIMASPLSCPCRKKEEPKVKDQKKPTLFQEKTRLAMTLFHDAAQKFKERFPDDCFASIIAKIPPLGLTTRLTKYQHQKRTRNILKKAKKTSETAMVRTTLNTVLATGESFKGFHRKRKNIYFTCSAQPKKPKSHTANLENVTFDKEELLKFVEDKPIINCNEVARHIEFKMPSGKPPSNAHQVCPLDSNTIPFRIPTYSTNN